MEIKIKKPLGIFETGCRSNMEDCIYPVLGKATAKDKLFVLCDGMGGHDNGEVASGTVCRAIADYIQSHSEATVTDETIKAALDAAIDALDVEDTGGLRKMGTTMTLLCFHRGGCLAAHIGDSRIYHIRPKERRIMYKSRDHSLVYDLYCAGEINKTEIATYSRKNVITRAIMPNQDERPKADIVHITDIKAGDIFYICSDGMLEQMDDGGILEVFSGGVPGEETRKQLIELTKYNKDNHSAYTITVSDVIVEKGDENLCDDEATSKSNAVYIEAQREDTRDINVVSVSEETLPAEGMEENNRDIHNAKMRTLWMVLITVMVAVFLIGVLMKA